MTKNTDKDITAAARKSNLLDYILTAVGCTLILYCCVDWHFTSKRLRAELDACHQQLMENMEESTRRIQEDTERLKALNAENQSITAEEK